MSTISEKPPAPTPGGKGLAGRGVQAVGFLLGMALLTWCVWRVVSDEQQLAEAKKLAQSPAVLATLVALSIALNLATGMLFCAMVRPVAKLRVPDLLAINAISGLLNNLPFKLSLVSRCYFHRARDGMPVPLILAWMGATLCVMMVSLVPPLAATVLLRRVDTLWWCVVIGGTVLLAVAAVVFGRLTATERFWGWVRTLGGRFPGTLGRLTRWDGFDQFRRGPEMLGSASAVSQGVFWRSASMGLGVWRLAVAAAAVGGAAAMTIDQCVVADSVYFGIQATAPTGALGAREGGTVAAIAAIAGKQLPVVVLSVSAAETVANLIGAGVALLYLKLRKPGARPDFTPPGQRTPQKCTTGEPG